MRDTVLYIAMSLDGFAADAEGGVDWLVGHDPNNKDMSSYLEFIDEVDTVVLGYNTYKQIVEELSPNSWPYKNMKSYVLTHRMLEGSREITFCNMDISYLISELKASEGKKIWICGGARIVNDLIKNDLIDEYRITVIPTILGKGIRLFDNDNRKIDLQLNRTDMMNGMVELSYKRR